MFGALSFFDGDASVCDCISNNNARLNAKNGRFCCQGKPFYFVQVQISRAQNFGRHGQERNSKIETEKQASNYHLCTTSDEIERPSDGKSLNGTGAGADRHKWQQQRLFLLPSSPLPMWSKARLVGRYSRCYRQEQLRHTL